MSANKILFHALRFRLRDLPFQLKMNDQSVDISIDPGRNIKWKGKKFSFVDYTQSQKINPAIEISETTIKVPNTLKKNQWKSFLGEIETLADNVAKENLHDTQIWGLFPNAHATGFKEGTLPQSTNYLKEVYADKFIVPEKKGFVIDLRRSSRSHLISVDEETKSFFDAASQIGSLALGYNDPEKRGLTTHEENFEWNPPVYESEIYHAYSNLLKRLSGMPNVYFFNSGAEANEAALQLCVRKYPTRKKLLAFSGSFHGRTLLTIHLTHSPAKRLPFETYPGLVNFAPYPENKNPSVKIEITPEWTKLWASVKTPDFTQKISELKNKADDLLKTEIESLLYLKDAFEKEEYLATVVEPRQCEGGDRFASPRFYHAVRLLTRAYDVPLLFDEVQTGYGLGGPFFWHEQFQLKKADGTPDHPDCLTFAKKAQVAGVISLFEGPLKHEVSVASLHRGYLQAMATLVHEPVDFNYVMKRILEIQSLVGKEVIQNPRGQAQTFAFDLPSETVLNKLISYRFEEGILFYPAGEKTARFRLLRNFKNNEIDGLFTSLYRCFLRAAADKLIPEIPPVEKWLEKIPPASQKMFSTDNLIKINPWNKFPQTKEDIKKTTSTEWQNIFSTLLKEQRNCIRLESNKNWPLAKLNSSSLDDLISHYEKTPNFTWMDLLWHAARQQSWKLERLNGLSDLSKIKTEIESLEKACYEPARQTEYSEFENCLNDGKGLVIICKENSKLIGIAACGALPKFKELKLLKDDPTRNDPQISYSIDVTVELNHLHHGLGLRLKAEQILELTHDGAKAIRSRNRFPEAASMIRLNHGFGSQVLAFGDNIYTDGGAAFYQSLKLSSKGEKIWNPRHPSVFNKGSLTNFVSPAYVDNMLILKELLPTAYKHVYLASSRAEAMDKAIKCLRFFKPQGKQMASFMGDQFGNTTASTATLSGETKYFDWPQFKDANDPALENWVKNTPPELIFGCALEWKNNTKTVKERIEKCRSLGVPTILKECLSTFWQGSKENFILSGTELDPDILYFGLGPQVAVVACKESFFVDKPLSMISTWDGDEHGLCLFQDKVFSSLENT